MNMSAQGHRGANTGGLARVAGLAGALSVLLAVGAAAAEPREPVEVLTERGCLACHRVDDNPGPAPSLGRLFGRQTKVVTPAGARTLRIDANYVRRSIRQPSAEVVEGYRADGMPVLRLDDAAVDEVVDALQRLEPEASTSKSLVPLAVGTVAFLLLHLGMSFHPVRRRLIERLGERKFQGMYAVMVGIAFILIIMGWVVRPFVPVWDPPSWTRWIPVAVMPLSFIALVAGFLTKNPAAAGQIKALSRPPEGAVAISRHPALWGFASWGLAHLAANGDLASILLFGCFALLAFLGMLHIDARRARSFGADWEAFAEQTSILPFAAILRGKAHFGGGGLGWKTMVGLVAYLVMIMLHEWEFGVSPMPY